MDTLSSKLVNAVGLLEQVFAKNNRPSLRWVREQQKNRTIPFIKIGKFVFFDPPSVVEALAKKHTLKPRS